MIGKVVVTIIAAIGVVISGYAWLSLESPDTISAAAEGAFLLGLAAWVFILATVAHTRLPLTAVGWGVVAAVSVAGTALSLLITRDEMCCMYAYTVYEGYPFPWQGHHMVTDDMLSHAHLHRLLEADPKAFRHRTNALHALADAVFWATAALSVVVPVRWALHRRVTPAIPTRRPTAS